MAASRVLKTEAAPKKKGGFLRKLKLGLLGVVVLGGAIGYESGYLGWGWPEVLSRTFPGDESLLGWVPSDEAALVIVDAHRFHFASLGSPGGVRGSIGRFAGDFMKATGVDLTFQVDKLAISRTVAAVRGRFNPKKIADRLAELQYLPADRGGFTYFTKRGEDACAIVGDEILIYGTEEGVKAALDGHGSGASLQRDDNMTARLSHIGWKNGLIIVYRLQDDRPSVRSMVSGTGGPRSVTIGAIGTEAGLAITASLDLPSPSAGADFAKGLAARTTKEALAPLAGDALAAALAPVAAHMAVTNDGAEVKVTAHADPTEAEAIARAVAEPGPVNVFVRAAPIVQLFAGAPPAPAAPAAPTASAVPAASAVPSAAPSAAPAASSAAAASGAPAPAASSAPAASAAPSASAAPAPSPPSK